MNADAVTKLIHILFAFVTDPAIRTDLAKVIADIKALIAIPTTPPAP